MESGVKRWRWVLNAGQPDRLQAQLTKLRLTEYSERLEALLQAATDKELIQADFLDQLPGEEFTSRTAGNIPVRTNLTRFPFVVFNQSSGS